MTRRTLLRAGLAALVWPSAGRSEPAAGDALYERAILRGRIGQTLRLSFAQAGGAPNAFALLGLRADPEPGFPGLGATRIAPGERRALAFTPREAGFGLCGAWPDGPSGAVVVAEAEPPPVDLEAVVVLSGDPAAPRANGSALPLTLSAPSGGRVRLRFANASPDTLWALATSADVRVAALDGQPCELFAPRAGVLPLCPTARLDLLFDLGEGGAEFTANGAPSVRIAATGARAAARPAILPLPANPRLPRAIALERALRATLRLTGRGPYAVNAVSGADWPPAPLFRARRGQPVALTLINATPEAQTLRLEGHSARLLHGLDDGWDPYWRDALYLEPGRTLHVAFVADNSGKWPLASASPAKRAQGLAAWFLVT